MIEKPALTEQPINKLIAERWSGRAYDSTLAVTSEQITSLLEAARWAPSCFGDQPWRFLVCDRSTDVPAWHKAFDSLSEGNQQWAENAPVLIVVGSVADFSHNENPNKWSGYDTGAASVSLCLQATAMGLVSHQMGGFDSDKVRDSFSIPADIQLWAMIAIGHPAPLDSLSQEQLDRELKERERRPLEQLFYRGAWPTKD